MLKLKIENYDRLPNGGPLFFQVDRRGFDIGRDQHLDWTLPDPTRYISGKHCEIRYSDGAYWLNDISTNGTFVNKGARRVQSPYKLANGDELLIGDYIISATVSVEKEAKPAPQGSAAGAPGVAPEDAWSADAEAAPPINREALLPPVQRGSRAADFLNSVANVPVPGVGARGHVSTAPPVGPAGPMDRPQTAKPSVKDPWGVTGLSPSQSDAPAPTPPEFERPVSAPATGAMGRDLSFSGSALPVSRGPDHGRPRPVEYPIPPEPPRPPTAQPSANQDAIRAEIMREFIARFAQGANIAEDVLARRDLGDLGQELGSLMRVICANLMQLLKDRAAAKAMSRSGQRTLIQHTDNNPLKFMPSPEEAMRVLFGPPSSSYMDSRQTFERTFADLRTHQLAVFAAMQQAFIQTVDDLNPTTIEQNTKGQKLSILGANKGRNWDSFVERWNARAGRSEHGMLDAFVNAFAEHYDRESKPKR